MGTCVSNQLAGVTEAAGPPGHTSEGSAQGSNDDARVSSGNSGLSDAWDLETSRNLFQVSRCQGSGQGPRWVPWKKGGGPGDGVNNPKWE